MQVKDGQIGALAHDSEQLRLPLVIPILDELEREYLDLVQAFAVGHLIEQVFRYGLESSLHD